MKLDAGITRRSLFLAAPFLLPSKADAQENKPAASMIVHRDVGLEKLLDKWREQEHIPAAYVSVYYQNKFYGSASGLLKQDLKVPATVKNRFRVGSVTKPMTSTLILLLASDGVLDLDASPVTYLPELARTIHTGYKNITLRHLLAHAAGLPSPGTGRELLRKPNESDADYNMRERRTVVTEDYFRNAPNQPVGKYNYANNGFMTLGTIAEAAAKKPYEQLMNERLFLPLGMSSSGVGMPGRKGVLAEPWYYPVKDGQPKEPLEPCAENNQGPSAAPQGNVYTSIEDACRFMRAHILWFQERAFAGLKTKFCREMFATPFTKDRNLAWQLWQEGQFGVAFSHGGQNADYRGVWNACQMRIIPNANAAIFLVATDGHEMSKLHTCVNDIQRFILGNP